MKDIELRKVLQKGNILYGIGNPRPEDGAFEVRRDIVTTDEKINMLLEYLGLEYKPSSYQDARIEKKKPVTLKVKPK